MKKKLETKVVTSLALLVALLPGVAQAQVLFQDQGATALPQGCNGNGCWTNYSRITDFDGDGDLDIVAVNNRGLFAGPQAEPLLAWTNNGSGMFTAANGTFGNLNAALRQVAFGDVDGDGDVDMFAPSTGNAGADRLFIQTGPGVYANEAATRLPASLSSDAGATRMGDLDNDGDLDLVVINGYTDDSVQTGRLYTNDGTGVFVASAATFPTTSLVTEPDDVDLGDVDRDFDLDILINAHSGQNALWINDGNGNFADASDNLSTLAGGLHYGPALCDVDGDGDLDMFVDNVGGNYLEHLALNDGSGVFTDATDQITGNIVNSDDNLIACADVDNDGDFDFVVGSLGPNERLFRNDGAGNFAIVTGAVAGPGDTTLWMEFGDLNNDNRLDFMTAQGEGSEEERLFFGTTDVPADSRAPVITHLEAVALSPDSTTVVRFAVSDNAVTDEGPRLSEAYLEIGGEQIAATFIGGDLYRAVAPMTPETEFNACAIDRAGNNSCDPGGEGGGGGGQGGNGQGGEGNGASSSSGGNGEGAADGVGGADGGDTDDGCGCSVPGERSSALSATYFPRVPSGALLLLGLGVVLARRRNGPRK